MSFAEIFGIRVTLRLTVSVEHRLMTDGRTDRQTDTRRQLISALVSVATRVGKNWKYGSRVVMQCHKIPSTELPVQLGFSVVDVFMVSGGRRGRSGAVVTVIVVITRRRRTQLGRRHGVRRIPTSSSKINKSSE